MHIVFHIRIYLINESYSSNSSRMESPSLYAVFHVQQQKGKTLFANVIIGIFGMGGVFHTHSYLLSTHTHPLTHLGKDVYL